MRAANAPKYAKATELRATTPIPPVRLVSNEGTACAGASRHYDPERETTMPPPFGD